MSASVCPSYKTVNFLGLEVPVVKTICPLKSTRSTSIAFPFNQSVQSSA